MQTHEDYQHHQDRQISEFMKRLRERADEGAANRTSEITTGKPGEVPQAIWKSHGVHCVHLPDDEQGIVRISIGGGNDTPVKLNYCNFRGSVGQCIALMERAIKALRAAP